MFLVQTDNGGHFILLLTFFVIEEWMGNKDQFEAIETVNIFVAKEIMSKGYRRQLVAVGLKIRFLAPGLYEAALRFMGS